MEIDFINSLARQSIINLKPYSSAREEYTGTEGIFMDANENPFNTPWNRYPDPSQLVLREKIAQIHGVEVANIILGNGSDEIIDLLFRTFCEPGKDDMLTVAPSYGMYKVCADINNIKYNTVILKSDFNLDVDGLLERSGDNTKLMFLCSPNNPTGNCFDDKDIEKILKHFKGLVIIDEAYIEFSNRKSWLSQLNNYPNLVVLQSLSKAWGLAAIRLGIAYAHEEIINLMFKVKPPYNINIFSQKKALEVLEKLNIKEKRIKQILKSRDDLMNRLRKISVIKKVYPTEANFFLIKVDKPDELYQYLVQNGIIIRNRSREPLCEGCLRITVGNIKHNNYLVKIIKSFVHK